MEAIDYYTYDDYKLWEGDWELMDGAAVAMSPAPMINHQAIVANIIYELKKSLGDRCNSCLVLGEADWKIDDLTVLRPDVVLICDEPNSKYMTKAPQIVVEVVSPSSARRDEKFKFEIYQEERVPYYILVYPSDLKAKLYRLDGNVYRKEGDFTSEIYSFKETHCKAAIDFDRVFKRFRK